MSHWSTMTDTEIERGHCWKHTDTTYTPAHAWSRSEIGSGGSQASHASQHYQAKITDKFLVLMNQKLIIQTTRLFMPYVLHNSHKELYARKKWHFSSKICSDRDHKNAVAVSVEGLMRLEEDRANPPKEGGRGRWQLHMKSAMSHRELRQLHYPDEWEGDQ